MPAPNELTEEDRRAFAEHGVDIGALGEGREPLGGEEQGQQQQTQEQQGQQEEQQPAVHGDRRPNGQFASREEREAAAQQTQQGQEQQTQQGEQQGQEQQGQQQSEQQPQMVPHQALHAERQRAAAAIRQAQLATTRLNAILAAQQGQGQQIDTQQMPDLNEDPAGYIQALENRLARFEQINQQENEFRQIDTALEQDEQLFTLQQPDYQNASDYYVQSRGRELLQFYPPEEAQRLMIAEAREIARQSWQRNMSPAQTIYALAQARGYQPGMGKQQQQQTQQPQGQQQQQQTQQPQGVRPQDQVRAIQQGQQASRSLSGGAGGQSQQLNAEALLAMNDEEFADYLALGKKGANERFAAVG